MSSPGKVPSHGPGPKPRRHSITLPAPVAEAVRVLAAERGLPVSQMLTALIESGLRSEAAARCDLNRNFTRFLEEPDPARKQAAGHDLIRAIFGADAIADDTVR